MLETKTRKEGDSIVVTLPRKDNKILESQKEYYIQYVEDGSIVLTPKIKDPFADQVEEGAYYEKELWSDMKTEGQEC